MWDEALEQIALSPEYSKDLQLTPQEDLLPIGKDPDSELWEFSHSPSGELAARDSEGNLILTPETGVILVLVPGSTSLIGSQSESKDLPRFDPYTESWEGPPLCSLLRPPIHFTLPAPRSALPPWRPPSGSENVPRLSSP